MFSYRQLHGHPLNLTQWREIRHRGLAHHLTPETVAELERLEATVDAFFPKARERAAAEAEAFAQTPEGQAQAARKAEAARSMAFQRLPFAEQIATLKSRVQTIRNRSLVKGQ